MVFPGVRYGCESWTINKAEQKSWCFRIVVLEKTRKSLWLQGNRPWITGRTNVKLQYFGHLMQRANSLEKTLMLGNTEGQRKERLRWREASATNGHVFQQTVKGRGIRRTAAHGVEVSDTTQPLNNKLEREGKRSHLCVTKTFKCCYVNFFSLFFLLSHIITN